MLAIDVGDSIANMEASVAMDAAVVNELGDANVVISRLVAPYFVERGANTCGEGDVSFNRR